MISTSPESASKRQSGKRKAITPPETVAPAKEPSVPAEEPCEEPPAPDEEMDEAYGEYWDDTSPPEIDKLRKQDIRLLLASLGIKRPKRYELYDRALTHSSFTYENKLAIVDNYERLEYLGDAVLKLVVSEYLFERFPHYREGELTKIRAVVVSDAKLAEVASAIHLGEYIVFGSSEAKSGGHRKVSNLACAFEALLGALYLDGKLPELHAMVCGQLEEIVTEIDLSKTKDNYKAVLQELTQAENGVLPSYRTVKETGPSHNRTFTVEVSISGEVMGIGSGKSKKEAQQQAARQALEVLNELEQENHS